MRFKFLEHTADAKFQAFGKSLEECFANAALALVRVMTDDKVKAKIEKKIEVKGEDKKALLYNFLEELLFLIDTQNFLLSKVKDIKIKNKKLSAVILGDDVKNYGIHEHIKAVTYNDMEIKESPFVVQVVVDI